MSQDKVNAYRLGNELVRRSGATLRCRSTDDHIGCWARRSSDEGIGRGSTDCGLRSQLRNAKNRTRRAGFQILGNLGGQLHRLGGSAPGDKTVLSPVGAKPVAPAEPGTHPSLDVPSCYSLSRDAKCGRTFGERLKLVPQ